MTNHDLGDEDRRPLARTKAQPWIVTIGPHHWMCPWSALNPCMCSILVTAASSPWREGYRTILKGADDRGLYSQEVLAHPLMYSVRACVDRLSEAGREVER